MFHFIQLILWTVGTATENRRFQLCCLAAAIILLGLSFYWFGRLEFTLAELLSSLSVAVLGTIIGTTVRRKRDTRPEDE